MATVDQAGQCELALPLARFARGATVQDRLDPLPRLARHERHVRTFICGAVEVEVARVNPLPKGLMDLGRVESPAADGSELARLHLDAHVAFRKPLEQARDDWAVDGVGLDRSLPVRADDVPESRRCERGPNALLGLGGHALFVSSPRFST